MSKYVLHLAGHQYDLEMVLKIASSGPVIAVKDAEINDPTDGQYPEHVVRYEPDVPNMKLNGILFYKQHGKYTVLSGQQRVKEQQAEPHHKGEVLGRLISSVMLKKTRIDEPAMEEAVAAKAEPAYNSEFANRPRITDRANQPNGLRRQYGNANGDKYPRHREQRSNFSK